MKRLHFLVACVVGASALTASAESKPQQTSTERIRVIAADDLFDKSVLAADGKDVGDIQYVLIRTDDAHIQQVVIESGAQGSAGQLIAVPFEAIQGQISGDEIRLTTSMDKINRAPRVTEAQLDTLTEEATIQKINSYWMPFSQTQTQVQTPVQGKTPDMKHQGRKTTTEKGLETEAMSEDQEQADLGEREQEAQLRDETMVKKEHEKIDGVPDEPNSRTPGEPETPGHERTLGQPGAKVQVTPKQPGMTTAQVQTTNPAYLVLTPSAYRVLQPNGTTPKDIEGMEVMSSDNKRLGDVEEIVIDLDSGCVAYTLVGRGGFLGLGMNYVAVPLQAIEFTNAENLRLKVPMRQFNSMRGYLDDDVPRSVTRSDLQRVYKQFKVQPYWTAKKDEVARK